MKLPDPSSSNFESSLGSEPYYQRKHPSGKWITRLLPVCILHNYGSFTVFYLALFFPSADSDETVQGSENPGISLLLPWQYISCPHRMPGTRMHKHDLWSRIMAIIWPTRLGGGMCWDHASIHPLPLDVILNSNGNHDNPSRAHFYSKPTPGISCAARCLSSEIPSPLPQGSISRTTMCSW